MCHMGAIPVGDRQPQQHGELGSGRRMREEQLLGRQPGAGAGLGSVETASRRGIEGQKGWRVVEDKMELNKETHGYAERQATNELSKEGKRANWVEGVEYR